MPTPTIEAFPDPSEPKTSTITIFDPTTKKSVVRPQTPSQAARAAQAAKPRAPTEGPTITVADAVEDGTEDYEDYDLDLEPTSDDWRAQRNEAFECLRGYARALSALIVPTKSAHNLLTAEIMTLYHAASPLIDAIKEAHEDILSFESDREAAEKLESLDLAGGSEEEDEEEE